MKMETQTTITVGAGAGFIWLLGIYFVGILITKGKFGTALIAPIAAVVSLTIHEYAHAAVAKMLGVAAPAIDVTDFAGIAHMTGFNPGSPEGLLILAAGPASNAVIAWLAWKYLKNRREVMWMVIGVNLLLIWLSYNEPNGDIRRMFNL